MSKNIVLYDDTCNLCNSSIHVLRNADNHKQIQFIPLNSVEGQLHALQLNLSETERNSVIHIKGNTYYTKSDAALSLLRQLKKYMMFYYLLRLIPKRLRNFLYDLVANNRYKWFGRHKQ
jgi:predicted DCC family thiol-disulfide oxidoreductase YuxK